MQNIQPNLLICCALGAVILSGCDPTQSEEYQSMRTERDSLVNLADEREQRLVALAESFDDIEQNLSAIERRRDTLINIQHEGRQPDQKARIDQMIGEIENSLADSREKIIALEEQIASSTIESKGLRRLVSRLRESIGEREQQVAELVATLDDVKRERDDLAATVAEKEEVLAEQESRIVSQEETLAAKEDELNKAYYLAANRKQLVETGVVKKEGGVLGIGRTLSLSEKQDRAQFNQLDIRDTREIYIGYTEKPKVVSKHPTDSYIFAKTNDLTKLRILNPDKFWSVSRYLVVEVEEE